MAIEIASAYVSLLPSAQGFGAKMGDVLKNEDLPGKLGSSFDSAKTTAVGVAAGNLIAAGIMKALQLGVDFAKFLPDLGEQFHQATAQIRVGTGEVGADLEELRSSFTTIFEQTPAGMDQVSQAVTTLHQRLGLTGPALEGVALQVLRLTSITGGDLKSNLKTITGLFNDWNIPVEQMPDKLDELLRVSQKTGITIDELTSQASESGATFRAIGLSYEDAIALIGQLNKAGLSASDVTSKFNRAIAEAVKQGKPAGDAVRAVFDAIKNAPNDTAAGAIALDSFGARGIIMAQRIREGKLAYKDLSDEIKTGDTINQAAQDTAGWSGKLEILKHKLLDELQPVAETVFGAMVKGAKGLSDWFTEHKPEIDSFITDLKTGLHEAADAWERLTTDPGSTVLGQFLDQQKQTGPVSGLAQRLNPQEQTFGDQFHEGSRVAGVEIDLVSQAWNRLVAGVSLGMGQLQSTMSNGWAAIAGGASAAWATIQAGWQIFVDGAMPTIGFIRDAISGVAGVWSQLFQAAWATITNLFDTGKALLSDVWQFISGGINFVKGLITGDLGGAISGFVEMVSGLFQGLKDLVGGILTSVSTTAKGIVNTGVAAANSFIDAWNGIQIPAVHLELPFGKSIDGGPWDLPDIPKLPSLARGGVISSPTLAVVGDTGPRTPEIVAPEPLMRAIVADEANRAGGGDVINMDIKAVEPRATAFEVRRKLQVRSVMRTGTPSLAGARAR